jgi:hypothetical protein
MKTFLTELSSMKVSGKKAFAFDTRYKSFLAGIAGKGIEKELKNLGIDIVHPYSSAIVKGNEGPLEEGAKEKFRQIGVKIAQLVQ